MNQEQYERARAIIRADCEIAGLYIDEKGKTCAVGALMKATTPKFTVQYELKGPRSRVVDEFGLSLLDLRLLIGANDRGSDIIRNRRKRVLRVLDKIRD